MRRPLSGLHLLFVAFLAGPSCDSSRPEHPVALIGFDGLEWSIAAPLIRDGKMPHLRSLVERGSAGYLYTRREFLSPVVWTDIATGKSKTAHGIQNFRSPDKTPYTSESRRGKALWNIASDYDRKTLCVGWWVTWPAEAIEGWMVAPYSAAGQNNINWKGNMQKNLPDQTYPPELFSEVWPIAEQVSRTDVLEEVASHYFDPVSEDVSELEKRLEGQTRWSIAADETYLRVAKELLGRDTVDPDLTMVYFGATDVASHRFWRYMEPEAFEYATSPESIERYGKTIERAYLRADRMLGDLLATLPEDTNVIVCSDHGFHAEYRTVPHARGISGHHLDGPPGVIIAAGPDIVSGFGSEAVLQAKLEDIRDLGWTYDIAPVVLYLLGIPSGEDMLDSDGGPLFKAAIRPELKEERELETIPTHDEGFREPRRPRSVSSQVDRDIEQWMRETGYLGMEPILKGPIGPQRREGDGPPK